MADQGKGCGALLLSIVAIAIAGYLLVDRHEERSRAQREEFREVIVKLQEASVAAESAGAEASAARPWIYYDAARKLEDETPDVVGMVDYIILANFAFDHSDLTAADQYVRKARRAIDQESDVAVAALGYGALAHIYFRHAPKTELAKGREFNKFALEKLDTLDNDKAFFIQLSLHQEWAMDEYSSGDQQAGDAQVAQAKKLIDGKDLSKRYVADWQKQLDEATIRAKVRGGLL